MFLPTSIQNRETWYTLREFETYEITSRRYARWHEKDLNAAKATAIAANFIQAREYYQSAAEADFTVRPLLQYYGVSTLSRGLALFLKEDDKDTLEAHHGLKTCSWSQMLSGNHPDFGQLTIKLFEKGVFRELLAATKGKCYLRHHSAGVNQSIRTTETEMNPGSRFTFKEITARVPGISAQYAAWTGSPPPSSVSMKSFRVRPDKQNRYEYTVSQSDDVDLNTIFPAEKCPNLEKRKDDKNVIVEYDKPFVPFVSQDTIGSIPDIGVICLYSSLDSGKYFTPLSACFMLSYILSMLCRYHPVIWTGLVRFGKKDAVYPLVVRILDWIQDMFPAMVVDILQGPYDFEKED